MNTREDKFSRKMVETPPSGIRKLFRERKRFFSVSEQKKPQDILLRQKPVFPLEWERQINPTASVFSYGFPYRLNRFFPFRFER